MTELIHELDYSSTNPNNLVVEESHTLENATALIIVADTGLFYTKSLVIRKVATNTILTLNVDYTFEGFDAFITARTGYECACAIAFIDPTISGQVTLTYQAVGGIEGELSSLIRELRDKIAELASTATWAAVINKPETYPPAPHTHNILTDLTGLAALRDALFELKSAISDSRVATLSNRALSDKLTRMLGLLTIQRQDINNISSNIANAFTEATTYGGIGSYILWDAASNPVIPLPGTWVKMTLNTAINVNSSQIQLMVRIA